MTPEFLDPMNWLVLGDILLAILLTIWVAGSIGDSRNKDADSQ